MGPIDIIAIAVIMLIVGGASYYIYRSKKSGRKCIGCPHSATCHSGDATCTGKCSSCSACCHTVKEKTE